MYISSKLAFLIFGLLVFGIASSVSTHSINGASTQNNITDSAASDTNMTTNNVIQKPDNDDANTSKMQSTNSDPFKEMNSIPKINLSDALESQDKHSTDKGESQSSSSSSEQASDSSCSSSNDGNDGCRVDQKSVKNNNDDSKNKDGPVEKEQKHKTRQDVKSIKDKIKADIKNRFKLPIDIPFP